MLRRGREELKYIIRLPTKAPDSGADWITNVGMSIRLLACSFRAYQLVVRSSGSSRNASLKSAAVMVMLTVSFMTLVTGFSAYISSSRRYFH